MATIALPGLASGIDTTALITALVNAESAPMQLLQARQTTIKQQNTDLTTFGTDVDAVKTALDGIRNAATLSSYTVSSTSTAVTLSPATHRQLATRR